MKRKIYINLIKSSRRQKRGGRFLVFGGTVLALAVQPLYAEAATCAKAQVVSGRRCEFVEVNFDLSGCAGERKSAAEAEVKGCASGKPVATYKGKRGTYVAALEAPSSADDGWLIAAPTLAGAPAEPVAKAAAPEASAVSSSPAVHAASGARVASAAHAAPVAAAAEPSAVSAPAATAAVAAPPAPAPTPTLVTFKGHFRLRAEQKERTDLASEQEFASLRIRPAVTFAPKPELSVTLEPQFSRTFGERIWVPAAATGINANTQASGLTTDPNFLVHQGFADYRAFEGFSLKAGRQVLAYGDELVIGASDWGNIGRSFDAVRARYAQGPATIDLFASKLVDTNTALAGVGDKDFYGLYTTFDLGAAVKALDFYLLDQRDSSTTAATTNLWVAGLRAKSKVGVFVYRAEATREFGSALGEAGYQLDAELGVELPGSSKVKLSVEGLTSGQDYNQLFATTHKWLGYADVFGRRNITSGVLHASVSPLDKLTTQLDLHLFSRTSDTAPAYKVDGSTALGTVAGSASKSLGTEVDLTLIYDASDALSFSAGASTLAPGDYLTAQFGEDHPWFGYAQMMVKF
jgi:hypothetical protein